MPNFTEVLEAWKADGAEQRIHPTRQISEEAYWASGVPQAQQVIDLVPEHGRVIDFGAGDGRVSIPMHAGGLTVLAVDASEEMLQRLTDREPEIATLQSTGANLAKKIPEEHHADALVSRAVLIHHSYKDVARLVGYFAQVVKPGGLLIADWPVSENPTERDDWIGVTTWDRKTRDEVAAKAGWEPVDVEGDLTIWQRKDDSDIL